MREKRESAVELSISRRSGRESSFHIYPKIPLLSLSLIRVGHVLSVFVRALRALLYAFRDVLMQITLYTPGTRAGSSLTFAIRQMDRNAESPRRIISPGSIIDPGNRVRLSPPDAAAR